MTMPNPTPELREALNKCARCGKDFNANPLLTWENTCRKCDELNSIAFWHPRLHRLGFPTPDTILIHNNINLEPLAYNEIVEGMDDLVDNIDRAANKIVYPVFLRTGLLSGKHDWKDSCYLKTREDIFGHILKLVETSALATIDRFSPCDFFAVREFLKTEPVFTYFSGEMPITVERRLFIRDGRVECNHPYWFAEVFEGIEPDKIRQITELSAKDEKELRSMGEYVSRNFDGWWSCDFLKTKDGWYLTDMAIGEASYHIASCTRTRRMSDETYSI